MSVLKVDSAFAVGTRVFVLTHSRHARWRLHHVFESEIAARTLALKVREQGKINTQRWGRQQLDRGDTRIPPNLQARYDIYAGAVVNKDGTADHVVQTFGEWVRN